jgi:hypothetical protein
MFEQVSPGQLVLICHRIPLMLLRCVWLVIAAIQLAGTQQRQKWFYPCLLSTGQRKAVYAHGGSPSSRGHALART